MNAAETIAAAIDKLESLKAESDSGAWFAHQNILGNVRVRVTDLIIAEVYGDGDDDERSTANAELIVTLHRTLDAQLAILRNTLEFYRGDLGIGKNRLVVDLARAILGVSS